MDAFKPEEKIEIFKVLYPLFKQEVYQRRDQILKVASGSAAFFVMLIFLVSWGKAAGYSFRPYFLPLVISLCLFEGVICYHLFQHKSRHEQAKRMLIDLEDQMGFFNNGVMEPSKRFYPEHWKLRGVDPGFVFYPVVHGGLILFLGWILI